MQTCWLDWLSHFQCSVWNKKDIFNFKHHHYWLMRSSHSTGQANLCINMEVSITGILPIPIYAIVPDTRAKRQTRIFHSVLLICCYFPLFLKEMRVTVKSKPEANQWNRKLATETIRLLLDGDIGERNSVLGFAKQFLFDLGKILTNVFISMENTAFNLCIKDAYL